MKNLIIALLFLGLVSSASASVTSSSLNNHQVGDVVSASVRVPRKDIPTTPKAAVKSESHISSGSLSFRGKCLRNIGPVLPCLELRLADLKAELAKLIK